jgi:hypothetical protein
MNRIIYVPGKNPKPPAQVHRELLLRCLLEGVRRIDPQAAADIAAQDAFTTVAWSQLFYGYNRPAYEDLPWIEQLLSQQSWREDDSGDSRHVKYRITRAMYLVGDFLPWLIPLLPDLRVKLSIRETEAYFSNHGNLGNRIRELQKQPLREAVRNGDRVLLIGHSMGSIIAYDSLWELDHLEGIKHCVDCFLTIGSPLGMNYVQKRLIGMNRKEQGIYPGNIRRWVNITARGDLVALDPALANDFEDMVENGDVQGITDLRDGIYNHYRDEKGLNVHKSYGYLVNPHVAQVIADWWNEA